MSKTRKLQLLLASLFIITAVIIIPYSHYRVKRQIATNTINENSFLLEEIHAENIPDEVYFLSRNILKDFWQIDNKQSMEIFMVEQNDKLFLALRWLEDFPAEQFNDCSFYIYSREEGAEQEHFVGDILTMPYKNLFVRYPAGRLHPQTITRLVIKQNFSQMILAEKILEAR